MREYLITSSLCERTRRSYERFWSRFCDFVNESQGQHLSLPVSSNTVSLFVAHLFSLQLAPSTISSHLSAIAFFHEVAGFHDPCSSSLIKRMLLGCRKLRLVKDNRLPLLSKQIQLLLTAVDQLYLSNRFLRSLYKAIILVTFHGFFRMGELLPASLNKPASVVQLHHTSISHNTFHIQLHCHKTRKSDKPVTIIIRSQPEHCPVVSIKTYLAYRGKSEGPLFISSTQQPITLANFRSVFNKLLTLSNLSPLHYKLHSFRIGACTQAVMLGIPESDIMQMGRWRSHAFRRYIRVPKICMSSTLS